MHEENYTEEEHGQPTASLGDSGEGVQVRTRNGLIRRRLERAKMKHFVIDTHHRGRNLKGQPRRSYREMCRCWYFIGKMCQGNITEVAKRTNKTAKNVKCEHLHVILSPFCIVRHPSVVQFGWPPKRQDCEYSAKMKLEGSQVHLSYKL